MICFASDTAIATSKGEVALDELALGDKVFTRDSGLQPIRWIGQKELTAREMERKKDLMPVLIEAGALGGGLPERDLMVSPQHRVLLAADRDARHSETRDVLSAAQHLVGLPGISRVKPLQLRYVHILCDQTERVLTNGCWTDVFHPAERVRSDLDDDARDELFRLFPELADAAGVKGYTPHRGAGRQDTNLHLVK